MANFIGVGLDSGGVASTTFTPSGCAALGTVTAPAPITLTLTGDAGTLPCAALLEFSGDDTSFTCYEIEGQLLATPVAVGSLPLNVRYLSWEQGTAITLKFYPVLGDGTEKTCDIVIKDSTGNTVGTLTLSATYADPVIAAIEAAGDVLGLFTAQDISLGAVAADGMVCENIADADADYQLYTQDNTKSIVAGPFPGMGGARSVSRYVQATAIGNGKRVGVLANWGVPVKSYCFIIQTDWDTMGTSTGRPAGTGATKTSWDFNTYSFKFRRNFIYIIDNNGLRTSMSASGTKAYFCAVRVSATETTVYVSDMEGAWKDTKEYALAVTDASSGLGFFNDTPNYTETWNLMALSTHSSDIGEAGLEAIYDACKA